MVYAKGILKNNPIAGMLDSLQRDPYGRERFTGNGDTQDGDSRSRREERRVEQPATLQQVDQEEKEEEKEKSQAKSPFLEKTGGPEHATS